MSAFIDRETEMTAGYAMAGRSSDDTTTPPPNMGASPGAEDGSSDSSSHQASSAPANGADHPIPIMIADPGSDAPTLPGLNLLGDGASTVPGLNLLGDGADNPLKVAGDGALLQPIFNAENEFVREFHSEAGHLATEVGVPDIVTNLTAVGKILGMGHIGDNSPFPDGHVNVITDTLNAPGSILDGHLDTTIEHLGADLTDTIDQVMDLKDAVVFGNDPLNPVPGLINSVGHDLQTTPLLTIDGGNNANDGGVLGGTLGTLDPGSNGHLIDVEAGPEQSHGLVLDLLDQPQSGPHHAVEVHAVDVSAGTPQLVDLGLLTGGPGAQSGSNGLLNIPSLNGAGGDALVGNVLNGSVASGNTTSSPVTAPVDVNAIHDIVNAPLVADHGVLDTHGGHIL